MKVLALVERGTVTKRLRISLLYVLLLSNINDHARLLLRFEIRTCFEGYVFIESHEGGVI